jgi:hypothetical protein
VSLNPLAAAAAAVKGKEGFGGECNDGGGKGVKLHAVF